jgi:hypothetical protein
MAFDKYGEDRPLKEEVRDGLKEGTLMGATVLALVVIASIIGSVL